MLKIGITERGDAGLDLSWRDKVSSRKVNGIIAITKDPEKLLQFVPIKCPLIIHCTITGLGRMWEPNVPQTMEAIRAYQDLVYLYGGDKVILRIDPIIPYMPFIENALSVLKFRKGKVRISFMDMYPHVRLRFLETMGTRFNLWEDLHAPLTERLAVLKRLEQTGPIEVCGEPGIPCTGCVSKSDLVTMGLESPLIQLSSMSTNKYPLKGQRTACKCLAVKTELLSNRHRCPHKCLYCYWKDQGE